MSAITANDPMAALEQAAKREVAEQNLFAKIDKAKRMLILGKGAKGAEGDAVFWATLALRLKVVVDWEIDTAATDGKHLLCNPEFFAKLSDAETVGVVAHEVGHCSLAHCYRLESRELSKWNIAADSILNPILKQAGFTLPAGALFAGVAPLDMIQPDMSSEQAYNLIPDNPGKGNGKGPGGWGPGKDPGNCGGVKKPGDGSKADAEAVEAEWKVKVAEAKQIAKMRGAISAGLDRLINDVLNPKVDCWEYLREFLNRNCKPADYAWTPPNRRFASQGLYLPGRQKLPGGKMVVMVDTSGSIGESELALFAGCVEGLGIVYPGLEVTVLYHDSAVCHVQEWKPEDGSFKVEPKGGGGTSHIPVFAWIDENMDEAPDCVVALTDLCSSFPKEAPDYPVLWASTVKGANGPFGDTVEIV